MSLRLGKWLASILIAALAITPTSARGDDSKSPWIPLIQRNSLEGWTQRGGNASYSIEDGQIVGRSRPNTPNSFLCTEREFGDFILELEFKVDPRLNSGVQIRSASVPGYRNGQVHGYQVEIDPSDRAWSAGIYDESRRGWLASLEDNEAARAAFRQNEWNKLRVEARGDSIRTWINGVLAADLRDSLTRTGFIGLQVHAVKQEEPLEVRWRNIRIKDLGLPNATPPRGAVVLLDATGDRSAWRRPDESEIEWPFEDGALRIKAGSGSILSKQHFRDCRIHVEFNVPNNSKTGQDNGNSGVYIQGRYEVQVLNTAGAKPAKDGCGAIYGVKAPDFNMARPPGEWQSYDIAFRAPRWDQSGEKVANAHVTVYHNGTRIHDDVELPDKTGAGMPELPEPGPLLLQDHNCRVSYRNIWVEPLRAGAAKTDTP